MRNYHRINPLFRFAVNMPVNRVFNLFIFLLLFSEFLLAQSVGRFGFSFRLFFGVRDAVLCVLRIQLNRPSGVLRSHWCYCVSLFRIRWIRSVYCNTNPFGSLLLLRVYTNRAAAAAAVFVRVSFCHAPTHSFKQANKQTSERNDTDTNTHAIAQRQTHTAKATICQFNSIESFNCWTSSKNSRRNVPFWMNRCLLFRRMILKWLLRLFSVNSLEFLIRTNENVFKRSKRGIYNRFEISVCSCQEHTHHEVLLLVQLTHFNPFHRTLVKMC